MAVNDCTSDELGLSRTRMDGLTWAKSASNFRSTAVRHSLYPRPMRPLLFNPISHPIPHTVVSAVIAIIYGFLAVAQLVEITCARPALCACLVFHTLHLAGAPHPEPIFLVLPAIVPSMLLSQPRHDHRGTTGSWRLCTLSSYAFKLRRRFPRTLSPLDVTQCALSYLQCFWFDCLLSRAFLLV